jgi:DNA-directed RNA polymerase specialized sigma subunit
MKNGLRQCSMECMRAKKRCKKTDCRHYIEYEDEYNCTLVSIYENGPMTLRQVGERIGVSFARIKQIEVKALKKIKNSSLISFLN